MSIRRLVFAVVLLFALGTLAACGDDDATATDPDETETPAVTGGPRTTEMIELTQPEEGAVVSDSFDASGKANSPEANVPWEIRDEDGEVVLDGFATAKGWMDKLYPWKTSVDVSSLDPGSYLFVAMIDDPSGGEGPAPDEVSAAIVVV